MNNLRNPEYLAIQLESFNLQLFKLLQNYLIDTKLDGSPLALSTYIAYRQKTLANNLSNPAHTDQLALAFFTFLMWAAEDDL